MRLFIERAGLGKSKLYNPKHPKQVKKYNLSLFVSGQASYLISTVDFFADYDRDRKHLKKLNNLESLFFVNARVSPELYMEYINLLQGRINYMNKKTFREHNIIFFITKLPYSKEQIRQRSIYIYIMVNLKDEERQDESEKEQTSREALEMIMSAQVGTYGRILMEPLAIDAADAELFSYRISNLMKSLSPYQIKLARLIENKKMILKSSKMKEYFYNHQNERNLLIDKLGKLCKKFHKNVIKIPEKVPHYLNPSFLKDNERKQGKLHIFKKRMKNRQKIENDREQKEKKIPKLNKKIKKKSKQTKKVVDIPQEKETPKNDLYDNESDNDDFGFDEENYLDDQEMEEVQKETEEMTKEIIEDKEEERKEEKKEITRKDLRNFEHPLLRDPKTLRSLSARKIWQKKHGIKKKKNKRLIRKGFYN
jgi:hypothetical protein